MSLTRQNQSQLHWQFTKVKIVFKVWGLECLKFKCNLKGFSQFVITDAFHGTYLNKKDSDWDRDKDRKIELSELAIINRPP